MTNASRLLLGAVRSTSFMLITWACASAPAHCQLAAGSKLRAFLKGLPECSPLIEIRRTCKSTLWTYEPQNSDGPHDVAAVMSQTSYSPIPIRARPSVEVIAEVHKRPLEQVTEVTTYNGTLKPTVFNTLLSQVSKPLTSGLIILSSLSPSPEKASAAASQAAEIDLMSHARTKVLTKPEQKQLEKANQLIGNFKKEIEMTDQSQKEVARALQQDLAITADLNREIADAQAYPPNVDEGGDWSLTDETVFTRCIQHILARIHGEAPGSNGYECGNEVSPHRALRAEPYTLPTGIFVDAKWRAGKLDADLKALKQKLQGITASEATELHGFELQIVQLSIRQDQLATAYSNAQTTQQTFLADELALPDCLRYMRSCDRQQAWDLVNSVVPIDRFKPPKGTNSGLVQGSAAFTTQTPLTNQTANAGTVAVSWAHQPWEVSGGFMWSNVASHTFQNSPVIQNGNPTLVNGSQSETVTETTSKPTLDALVLVHYRIYERPGFWHLRFAILGSAGVGTGTNGSPVDGVVGVSFAFGNLYISPLLHFTRDTRLTDGVKVGTSLGASPAAPPTEQYWVHKFGIAVTYGIPLT